MSKKILRTILNIISYILIGVLLIYLIIIFYYKILKKNELPKIFKYYVFEVMSGSMEENLHIGDYIIVKDTEDYDIDDIITYKIDNQYVTHRIVEISDDKIVTKGDANNVEDEEISKKNVVGKYICKINIMKYKYFIIAILVVLFLLTNIKEK